MARTKQTARKSCRTGEATAERIAELEEDPDETEAEREERRREIVRAAVEQTERDREYIAVDDRFMIYLFMQLYDSPACACNAMMNAAGGRAMAFGEVFHLIYELYQTMDEIYQGYMSGNPFDRQQGWDVRQIPALFERLVNARVYRRLRDFGNDTRSDVNFSPLDFSSTPQALQEFLCLKTVRLQMITQYYCPGGDASKVYTYVVVSFGNMEMKHWIIMDGIPSMSPEGTLVFPTPIPIGQGTWVLVDYLGQPGTHLQTVFGGDSPGDVQDIQVFSMASGIWDQPNRRYNSFFRADATLSDKAQIFLGDIRRPNPSVSLRYDGAFQRAARFFRVERGTQGYYLDELRIIISPTNGPAVHGGTHAITLEYCAPTERVPRVPTCHPEYIVNADGLANMFAAVPALFESESSSESEPET